MKLYRDAYKDNIVNHSKNKHNDDFLRPKTKGMKAVILSELQK